MNEFKGWYAVYPGGEKLDLTWEIKPVALFEYESHAREFVKRYGPYGEVKQI